MEKKGEKKNGEHCCGLYCSCGKMSGGHMLIKLFLALGMISLVLAICLVFFMKIGKWARADYAKTYGVSRGQIMMQQGCPFAERGGAMVVMEREGNIMFRAEKAAPIMPERMFATVMQIDGNKITVKNNAAMEQVVLTMADTVIIASSTEVGLPALQPEMDIVVYGSVDKDNNFQAKLIQIQ